MCWTCVCLLRWDKVRFLGRRQLPYQSYPLICYDDRVGWRLMTSIETFSANCAQIRRSQQTALIRGRMKRSIGTYRRGICLNCAYKFSSLFEMFVYSQLSETTECQAMFGWQHSARALEHLIRVVSKHFHLFSDIFRFGNIPWFCLCSASHSLSVQPFSLGSVLCSNVEDSIELWPSRWLYWPEGTDCVAPL